MVCTLYAIESIQRSLLCHRGEEMKYLPKIPLLFCMWSYMLHAIYCAVAARTAQCYAWFMLKKNMCPRYYRCVVCGRWTSDHSHIGTQSEWATDEKKKKNVAHELSGHWFHMQIISLSIVCCHASQRAPHIRLMTILKNCRPVSRNRNSRTIFEAFIDHLIVFYLRKHQQWK